MALGNGLAGQVQPPRGLGDSCWERNLWRLLLLCLGEAPTRRGKITPRPLAWSNGVIRILQKPNLALKPLGGAPPWGALA
jgi:hypothetical protein